MPYPQLEVRLHRPAERVLFDPPQKATCRPVRNGLGPLGINEYLNRPIDKHQPLPSGRRRIVLYCFIIMKGKTAAKGKLHGGWGFCVWVMRAPLGRGRFGVIGWGVWKRRGLGG